MKKTVNIDAQFRWEIAHLESGGVVGTCDELNLVLSGNNLDEFYSIANEGINLLMLDLLHDNELDSFLKENGWQARGMAGILPDEDVQFVHGGILLAMGPNDSTPRTH